MLNYDTSYRNAIKLLQETADLDKVSDRRGAERVSHNDKDCLSFKYFGEAAMLCLPDCSIEPDSLDQGELILILHYFETEGSPDTTAPEVTFQSLPGGMFYYPTFRKRGPNRVLNDFGENPEDLIKTGEKLNWKAGTLGDASLIVPVLPEIFVTVVLHAGDEEFPSEAQFLFKKDILSLIPLEDVAVIGTILATKLTIAKHQ
ncbi:MAG: DUF3786 domain-containing protein [Spirochaetales bacterium]|jgi:hypothetical protein|nr:DUF3786 domain-containing protein [Spirochaetales bacterium]